MFDWITTVFLISQLLVWIAIITDFLSFQYKDRKKVLILLTISATLVAIHYLLLWKLAAFNLVVLWVLSFIISIFTHNKKILSIFFLMYIIAFWINYNEVNDIVIFLWLFIILISKFQKNDKNLRLIMMSWTCFVILYNILIFTPLWVVLESLFLGSNIIWFYKHYIKKKKQEEIIIFEKME